MTGFCPRWWRSPRITERRGSKVEGRDLMGDAEVFTKKKKKITLMIYTQYQDQSDRDQWTRTINVP